MCLYTASYLIPTFLHQGISIKTPFTKQCSTKEFLLLGSNSVGFVGKKTACQSVLFGPSTTRPNGKVSAPAVVFVG